MKKIYTLCFLILSLLFVAACQTKKSFVNPEIETALKNLDHSLDNLSIYSAIKSDRIDSLRRIIPQARTNLALYDVYDKLFDEYKKWNCDSALFYAHRKENLANKLETPSLLNDAAEDIASRYIISGMYLSALDVISKVDARTDSFFQREPSRLLLMYEVYHNLVIAFNDKYAVSDYEELEAEYLEMVRQNVHAGAIDYYNYLSKVLLYSGKGGQLIILLQEMVSKRDILSASDNAVLDYWLGKAYETLGDDKNAFLHYANSARYDMESANREYRSLIYVAKYCFENGMTERAHRYITRCHEDALLADAHRRLAQISDIMSSIESSYDKQAKKQRNDISILNIYLIISLCLLVIAIIYLVISLRKNILQNKKMNENIRISQEANRIKQAYLGQFLTLFSNHTEALERYRSRLKLLAKKMDLDIILRELRSDGFINEELANVFDIFDKSFLGIFPNFPEQINSLLRPEDRINQDLPHGKLSNELRVQALIRLGVTDSKRIARLLRLSPSTVYNYRVKYRNASLQERETFEEKLSTLGA